MLHVKLRRIKESFRRIPKHHEAYQHDWQSFWRMFRSVLKEIWDVTEGLQLRKKDFAERLKLWKINFAEGLKLQKTDLAEGYQGSPKHNCPSQLPFITKVAGDECFEGSLAYTHRGMAEKRKWGHVFVNTDLGDYFFLSLQKDFNLICRVSSQTLSIW